MTIENLVTKQIVKSEEMNTSFVKVLTTLKMIEALVSQLVIKTEFEPLIYGKRLPAPYNDYTVTEDGRVFSHTSSGKVVELKTLIGNHGYKHMRIGRGLKRPTMTLHKIVCLAYYGPRPEGLVVRHLDGNPYNNHFENLKYGTNSENAMDRVAHGTSNRGDRNWCAKLTNEDALRIRARARAGESLAVISASYSFVDRNSVARVIKGQTFKNVAI